MVVTAEMAWWAPATCLRAGTLKTQTMGAAKKSNTSSLGTKQRLGYGGLVVGKWEIEIAGEKDLRQRQFHSSGDAALSNASQGLAFLVRGEKFAGFFFVTEPLACAQTRAESSVQPQGGQKSIQHEPAPTLPRVGIWKLCLDLRETCWERASSCHQHRGCAGKARDTTNPAAHAGKEPGRS